MELSGIRFDADAARELISRKEAQIAEVIMALQAEVKENGFLSSVGCRPEGEHLPQSRQP
jgi:hypothetical protein